ncbi:MULTISPECIES: YihY/virulence factor BrkB family protein [unclassified Sphingopyxis]|uniref:YihY/virulence factor BrkB family protein n=1 Tax=unclassified Sphingopyxis TaxID=2614943 RepID=UPI0028668F36|nr:MULTISPECIES: YihY/virulence factor BrkB family protein [unclassified Sphingopyxis]MDR6834602.1 membrane protein [Sphingopyxis sp. BE122]MDR7226872.1 membrane protein [Sphingopyxis sp. BE259]
MTNATDQQAADALARQVAEEVGKEFLAEGHSPHSPEARAERAKRIKLRARAQGVFDAGRQRLGPGTRAFHIVRRVVVGTYTDGFIHAGNLAYLALIALFPFFILLAAAFSLIGGSVGGEAAIEAVFSTMPPSVASALSGPIREVMSARTGIFLWLGALVALWTVGSLIETVRDILRRAYGTHFSKGFFHYRLLSIGIITGAVVLMLLSFSMQVLIVGVEQFVSRVLPEQYQAVGVVAISRGVSGLGLFLAIYMLFYSLTPSKYRRLKQCPKWPGALFTTLWWIGVTLALPPLLASLLSYDATYGSLAGVMVALFFFYLVGLGMVMGAELNAALVEVEDLGHDAIGRIDDVILAKAGEEQ